MDQENKVSKIIIILPSGTGKERKHSNLAGPTNYSIFGLKALL